jgi:hypothetical protein
VLLDFAHHKLHFEVVSLLLGDLIESVENGFQCREVIDTIDLRVEISQLVERILMFGAH